MNQFRFSQNAMATVFELIIAGTDKKYAEEAAWELWKEIDTLENELSRYLPNSDISKINNLKKGERFILSEDTFNCIRTSMELYNLTEGAFNIASGSLYNCWVNADKSIKNPTQSEIEYASKKSDLKNILLYDDFSIELKEEGMVLDLGAFGKGYSLDRGYELLKEWGIKSAFLSSGQSSIRSFTGAEFMEGWDISISNPNNHEQKIFNCNLSNISIGSSGLNKGFHIIDTKKMKPVEEKRGVWVFAESAAIADALSTAFMILDFEEIGGIINKMENIGAIIIKPNQTVTKEGIIVIGEIDSELNLLIS
ncbi:MAG: FAD:protein FMN transferase [Ignavibacteriaceae bacterium]|jgi:thiamine biosynthesis lipoprotein|nr:FAD:protein FMN transferase [Ignavibacteriaceae bacterium]